MYLFVFEIKVNWANGGFDLSKVLFGGPDTEAGSNGGIVAQLIGKCHRSGIMLYFSIFYRVNTASCWIIGYREQ